MGLFNSIRMGSSAAGDYEVERSLRFNDNDTAYLSRNFQSGGNRKKWTFSAWIKRSSLGGTNGEMRIFGGSTNASHIFITSADALTWDVAAPGSSASANLTTEQKFRDTSAWFHLVCAFDTDNSTANNRMRIYVNGTEVTSFGTRTNPSSGYAANAINADAFADGDRSLHTIGHRTSVQGSAGMEFDGYMAEINFIDGQQYDPSYFGETDAITGQWNPKKYAGGYGTTGFYLKFADNSGTTATTLGKDSSGNGNNFTPNNFVTGDAVKDSPTNNFATFKMMGTPFSSGASINEGALSVTTGASGSGRNLNRQGFAPFLVNSGKWYAEFMQKDSGSYSFIGVGPYQVEVSPTANNTRYAYVLTNSGQSYLRTAGSEAIATYGGSIDQYDVVGIYLDMDAGTPVVYFSKNGQWANGSGSWNQSSPSSGLTLGDSFFTTDTGENDGFGTFIVSSAGGGFNVTIQANFGQDSTFSGQITAGGNTDANGLGDFKYAVPTGALCMCSKNFYDPTILLPNQYFNTLLWTGNDSSDRDITGVGFQPDWLWIKNRSQSDFHHLVDAVRGANKVLYTNDTDNEQTDNANGHVNSFLADGFNVTAGASGNVNENNENYVGWNWNAGGTTVTNTNGTISSQVRASTTAGFSIVTYTGNGTDGATVGHGLGVAPDCILTRTRNLGTIGSAGPHWTVAHKGLTNGMNGGSNARKIHLSLTQAEGTNSHGCVSAVSSTTFTLKDGSSGAAPRAHVNESSGNYVAYVFSEVAGYSKFGSYRGNGNANGTFVYTGFRPAWVLMKRTDSTGNWFIIDNKRDPFNEVTKDLVPNSSSAETDNPNFIDFLSNGFKLRTTGTSVNSGTIIYLAFAESPFKNSRAR